jgi:hypothetical protein
MAKSTKLNGSNNSQNDISSSSTVPTKPKREVQVVTCPGAFPISTKPLSERKRPRQEADVKPVSKNEDGGGRRKKTNNNNNNKNNRSNPNDPFDSTKLLDWHETAKEIRAYGATAFVGQQKRNYEDEQYFQLTGRHKKGQKIPLPIVRGMKRAAAKKDAKLREEAKQAGVVLPKDTGTKNDSKKASRDLLYRSHGPAPNIGFMKGGVLRVSDKKKGKR